KIAAALYGLLTMPERGEVLEGIRSGDIGILYISPEQLRNFSFVSTISQREIGAWIFDEAHCLSKWGHDFRPDYLYSIRFIREFALNEKTRIPPVQCFTATAKKDVKAEITDIIQSELGLRVTLFEGGHERTNLHYEVWPVEKYEKKQTILELLRARYREGGSVVIYCASRKGTENIAEFLQASGYTAEAFHAGLEPSLKKRIQDNFIAGTTPVICATNAFGMGIDKDDVRLVIHADIPGSLENYLQEAGRAGRDRDAAECILIFTEQDIESQFRLSSMSRLTRREIAQLLRGIRYGAKGDAPIVLTAGELLRMDVVELDPDEHSDSETRVRTAVSWLERAGYLERNENNTRVFQGKLLVKNMQEAVEKIGRLDLSARQRERWLGILSVFMEQRGTQGVSADELASLSSFSPCEQDRDTLTEAQRVLRTLDDMAVQGLLSKETTLTAYVRYKVKKSSEKQLQRICALENDFLKVLGERAPDVDIETPLELDLRQVNQQLIELGYEYATPHSLKLILYGLSRDGKGLAGQKGSISIKARGNNRFTILLHRDWELLNRTVQIRQQAAHVTLQVILGTIDPAARPNANLLVEFTLEQIVDGLRRDLLLLPLLKDPLAAAERALTFMHEQIVIDLQHGLAVFRQAMTITINPEARGRRYSKADFAPLDTHYLERNFQIHVMNEYARQALEKLSTAMALVGSYFNDEKEDFVKRFFPGKKKFLERATSEQSYSRIVDDLKNESQEKIVAAPIEKNMLVLAGPGAGKTRVVAHRASFLLRVKRVKARAILILCFNRGAVMNLRQRLRDLVGNDMLGVTTLTFHGLALRLTGKSLVPVSGSSRNDIIDFSKVIQDAIRLLKGESDVIGFGDADPRDMLIGRFSHILVDEYQDIDEEQYELVSLLAGRTQKESDQKMAILAVGDDDQNIYRFRGANVGFIRKFHKDYDAQIHYLIENYRSTPNIIAAANMLISFNSDRMKTDYPIKVNQARQLLPPGGNWQLSDPIAKGCVQRIEVVDQRQQAGFLLKEICRLQGLDSEFNLGNCAILAREWKDLDLVRSAFDEADMAVTLSWGRSSGFPGLTKIRENVLLLEYLREHRLEMKTADSLLDLLPENALDDNLWQTNLRRLIGEWREETGNIPQPVPLIEDYFYEMLSDQSRSQNLGNGVFLSTAHSVKGLEFDHVFILGDSWQELQESEMEEERRLYYVAMSRARQTLHLFSLENRRNPHTEVLAGDYLVCRKKESVPGKRFTGKRYRLLGMKDLFIDFSGLKKEDHPVRKALEQLKSGDLLKAQIRNDNIELLNGDGISVARLSQTARVEWADQLDMIQEVRVVALVRRFKTDIRDTSFSNRCHGESWEVPVVEIIY
ncbi:MAG: RecQ family ATP-dependent DNA helicase, partial [Deltaproteobacteria bacterium]|nr:RecQ family ATP-dependent DNA helicase [Deltaproteobacteria bacterium]